MTMSDAHRAREERPKDPPKKLRALWDVLPRLIALAKRERLRIYVGTFFLFVGAAAGLAFPQVFGVMINQALGESRQSDIDFWALVMLGAFVVQGIAIGIRHYMFTVAGEHVVASLRAQLYESIIDQEIGFFDERRTGDFLGHSTIAGPAFPRFNQVFAEAGDVEELVTATLHFEKLHRWESIFPWRDWRAGHQSPASELIAAEFQKLVKGP